MMFLFLFLLLLAAVFAVIGYVQNANKFTAIGLVLLIAIVVILIATHGINIK